MTKIAPAYGRSVEEWKGRDADDRPPDHVRLRVFDARGGRCHMCTRKLRPGERWTCEHIIALCNKGENRESNLGITCDWCLPQKNADDAAEKSETNRIRRKHIGIDRPRGFGRWKPREARG